MSEADVAAEIRRNQSANTGFLYNFPKQMQALRDQLLLETRSGNNERAAAIQRELDDLFAQAEARKQETRVNMSAINKRNQRLNVNTLGQSRDVLLKLQRDEMEGRIDTADDPFARRMESSGAVRPLSKEIDNAATPKRPREGAEEPDSTTKRARHNDVTPEPGASTPGASGATQGKRRISLSDYLNRNHAVRT